MLLEYSKLQNVKNHSCTKKNADNKIYFVPMKKND